MSTFVIALIGSLLFSQWSAVDRSDILWLLPWLLVVFLLGTTARILWRALLLVLISGAALTFVVLVAYYLVAGI